MSNSLDLDQDRQFCSNYLKRSSGSVETLHNLKDLIVENSGKESWK